jgi:hypothetical protein
MRQSLATFERQIRTNPDFSPGGIAFAIPGVLAAGTATDMQVIADAANAKDLGSIHHIRTAWFMRLLGPAPGLARSEQAEILDRLREAVRVRVDELERRFAPQIALQGHAS